MKKNYVLSYKILPFIIIGYGLLTALIYLYCYLMVWRDGGTDPLGNYIVLALFSLFSLPILFICVQTNYYELKKHEPCEKWPPLWKHVLLSIASVVVGLVSFVLGIYMLINFPSI